MPRGIPGSGKAVSETPVAKAAGLTAKDVCDIIQACHTNKVLSLSFKDLSLSFQPTQDELVAAQTRAAKQTALTPEAEGEASSAALLAKAHLVIERLQADAEADRQLEVEISEHELEQIKVIDPVAYERIASLLPGDVN